MKQPPTPTLRAETLNAIIKHCASYGQPSRDFLLNILIDFEAQVQANAKQETLLELLSFFDDYNHPIEMTAEYVREQIIKFMEVEK